MTQPERQQVRSREGDDLKLFDIKLIKDSTTPAEIRRRFGTSADPHALFRIGPIPMLVGRSVQSLPQTTGQPIELRLTRFADVVEEDEQKKLPCYFEGSVVSSIKPRVPTILAVAINGTIHAVTQTILDRDVGNHWSATIGRQPLVGNHWSAMVPEWAFHPGSNDVRFFAVTGADWQLTPCVAVGPGSRSQ
jgi:hypothetical protein